MFQPVCNILSDSAVKPTLVSWLRQPSVKMTLFELIEDVVTTCEVFFSFLLFSLLLLTMALLAFFPGCGSGWRVGMDERLQIPSINHPLL